MRILPLILISFFWAGFWSSAQAETCPSLHGRVRLGGSSNMRCLCPRGFQKGEVRTVFRERGVDLARQCRKAARAAYLRCRKNGRVVQFRSRVVSSRLKMVMGYSRGYCTIRYSCRWSKFKNRYLSKARLLSFQVKRRIIRVLRRKPHSCTIFWKARLKMEDNRIREVKGKYREDRRNRSLGRKVLCKLAKKAARAWVQKKLKSYRYYCSAKPRS